jgi:flap endonuclease-1
LQFVDLCILLGCDYCDPIKGIGPQTALKLIREHKSIETILSSKAIDTTKHPLPERYPYTDARELFLKPSVADPETLDIKWGEPDVDGLIDFLVRDKGFSEERVRTGAARLSKGLKTKQQGIPHRWRVWGMETDGRAVGGVFQGFAEESGGGCKAEEEGGDGGCE